MCVLQTYGRAPVVLSHGSGAKVVDVEGKEYVDFAAGIAVNALGHSDPRWLAALTEQAALLAHTSNLYHTTPQVRGFRVLGVRQLLCVRTACPDRALGRWVVGSLCAGAEQLQTMSWLVAKSDAWLCLLNLQPLPARQHAVKDSACEVSS